MFPHADAASAAPPLYSRRTLFLALTALALILTTWLLYTPPGLLGKADAIGYAICHRIDARSFHIGNLQLPLCARCTGIYAGVLLGLGYLLVLGRGKAGCVPNWRIIVVLISFIALMGVDGVNSFSTLVPGVTGLYQPQNWLRLVTGTFNGIAIANLFFPMFVQTLWDDWDDVAGLQSWRELLGLVLAALALIGLILWENEIVLYVVGALSAGGVLLLLTCTLSMSFMLATNTANKAQRWRDTMVPLAAGLTISLSVILFIDVLRFTLTGTWGGFVIPGAF